MPDRVPQGATIVIDGVNVRVGPYIASLGCYRVSYAGPGMLASGRLIEDAYYEQLSTERAPETPQSGADAR